MAVVDGGGEEMDAVGDGGGEVLHGVDAGSEVAAVGELRDVRRRRGCALVADEIAGDEGGDEEDGQDARRRREAVGGLRLAGGEMRGGCSSVGWSDGELRVELLRAEWAARGFGGGLNAGGGGSGAGCRRER